ncbi:sensor histidine kinase [Variovorax saccharolyticus]|uniref:sensor histidine kinase n=1 Tax=Variovorax saccharolyticus TaxID=3053516 RepID=UPI002578FA20|nr:MULTISPECIES: ATP-binding protein [unclassified Variovorax]MDM0022336.1 ATP-binding protein [Variovorax sp. J22R187]MDM0028892.1 ATP-binding protein [Variovorax sp. J31P216]
MDISTLSCVRAAVEYSILCLTFNSGPSSLSAAQFSSSPMKHFASRLKLHAALLCLALASIVAMTAYSVLLNRAYLLKEANSRAMQTSRSLTGFLSISQEGMKNRIDATARNIEAEGLPLSDLRDHRTFDRVAVALDSAFIKSVVLFDSKGQVLTARGSSDDERTVGQDAAPLRAHHLAHPLDKGVHAGFPTYSPAARDWVFPLSRGLFNANGQAAGVLVTYVGLKHMRTLYEQLVADADAFSIAFVGADGQRLAWHPDIASSGHTAGEASFPLEKLKGREGNFDYVSSANQATHSYVYSSFGSPPTYLLVGYSKNLVLAEWQHGAVLRGLFALGCTLLLMAVAWFAYQEGRRLQSTNASISARNDDLRDRVADVQAYLKDTTAELDALASVVPHDLRNPARQARGYLALALQDAAAQDNQTLRSLLGRADDTVLQIEKAITKVLDLSAVNRELMEPQLCDFTVMAHQAVDQIRKVQANRRVSVNIEAGMMVVADCGLLQLALDNLIANAWKFTADQPNAELHVGRQTEGGRMVFFVKDNGMGFDPTKSDVLFEPFQRLHDRPELEGAGVGLATVRRVISRHKGRIWAEGTVGGGATFWFTLADDAATAASGDFAGGPTANNHAVRLREETAGPDGGVEGPNSLGASRNEDARGP